MRVVLDTNILVSALICPDGHPAAIYNVWESGGFTLVTCTEQIDELTKGHAAEAEDRAVDTTA